MAKANKRQMLENQYYDLMVQVDSLVQRGLTDEANKVRQEATRVAAEIEALEDDDDDDADDEDDQDDEKRQRQKGDNEQEKLDENQNESTKGEAEDADPAEAESANPNEKPAEAEEPVESANANPAPKGEAGGPAIEPTGTGGPDTAAGGGGTDEALASDIDAGIAKGGAAATEGGAAAGATATGGAAAAAPAAAPAAAAATGSAGLWIALALVVILFIVVIVAVYMNNFNRSHSPAPGTTQHQTVNPFEQPAVTAAANVQVDPDAKKVLAKKTIADIQSNLPAVSEEAANIPDKAVAAAIQTDIAALTQKLSDAAATLDNPDANLSQNLLYGTAGDGIGLIPIMSHIETALLPKMTEAGVSPLKGIQRTNTALHAASAQNPVPVNKDNGHGTYMFYGQNKGDAVDLYTAMNADVFAIFGGTIKTVSDDGTGNKKIVIGQGDYELLYAHIADVSLKEGATVKAGDRIGAVPNQNDLVDQIHLELSYCGKPITTSRLDKISYYLDTADNKEWGKYLWAKFKIVLNVK